MRRSHAGGWIGPPIPGLALVGLLYGVACFAALRTPGFRVPGYLSALAVGLLLFPFAPLFGFLGAPPLDLRGLGRRVLCRAAFLVGAPLALAGVQVLRHPVCDPGAALSFWLLGPVAGALFGVLLGSAVRGALPSRPRMAALVLTSVLLGSLGWHLLRLYTQPSVAFFHPIAGRFAGPIYDTDVRIGAPYLLHRLWWLGALPLLLAPWLGRRWRRRLLPAAGLWMAAGFLLRGPLGIDHDREDILGLLRAERRGRHVVLRADPGAYTAQTLDLLTRVLDFHAEELARWLRLERIPRVRVLLFADAAQKRAWMGAGRTEVAKPWLSEVYLGGARPEQSVLRHELAHALAAPIAGGLLGVPARHGLVPQMALVEGLATAATWERGALTPHGWTAAMEDLGIRPPLDQLLGPAGFWKAYGPMAYTVSASFVAWYREAEGVEALRRAYGSGDLAEAVGRPLAELEARWRRDCLKPAAARLDASARAVAKERFARRPVYQRPCGLEIGRRGAEAMERAAAADLEGALAVVGGLARATGGDPEVAALGVRAARAAGDPVAMLDQAGRILARPDLGARPALRAWLLRERADAAWWMGAPAGALQLLQGLRLELLDHAMARSIWMRRILLSRLSGFRGREEPTAALLDLLSGRLPAEDGLQVAEWAVHLDPRDSAARYLLAFQLESRGLWAEAEAAFAGVGAPALWPPMLIREAAYRAGRLAAWRDRPKAARRALQRALSFEPLEGRRTPIRRWLRFAAWRAKRDGSE